MNQLPVELSQLRQLLVDRYSEGELRTLCFDLGVDYESLPPGGKADKARELLADLERHGRVPALLEIGQRLRPDVDWSQAYLDDRMDDLRARRDRADQARRQLRARQRVVNLRPLDMTHTFKDRVRETGELCTHLAQENVRLISIVGRGGMGKTALVSRVLADLERGVLLVPGQEKELAIDGLLYLSALSTGLSLERIYADVGRMLGEPLASRLAARWASGEIPLAAKVEYLLETLQDGLYVILLDNLENYLSSDGTIADEGLRLFVERCLTQPGGARLIATSREQVQVIPAALRNARSIPLREGLPEDEAVALLRELDPQGELGLRDAPGADLRQAAQLTGGIPRALEIVAGILQADPTASLARLVNDSELFSGQVVENLVATSHQRLGENERCAMEALAIFDCPTEETAITYLLHPWYPGLDVRSCLRHLVSGYFVSANRVTGEYNLHPLDREYAYRHLPEEIETEIEIEKGYTRRNLELRVADFYASIRKPEGEWKTIDDLSPQLAEFEHRVRAGDYDNAIHVLETIDSGYMFLWGHYTYLASMRSRLLEQLTDPGLRADNLGSLGLVHYCLGQIKPAIQFYEEALVYTRKICNRQRESCFLSSMGRIYRNLGQLEQAIKLQEEALSVARELGDRRQELISLGYLGHIYRDIWKIGQAMESYKKCLTIARELGNRVEEGHWLDNLGYVHYSLGHFEHAIEFYEQAVNIARAVGDRRREGIILDRFGRIHRDFEQWDLAIDFHNRALAIFQEIGSRGVESVPIGWLGDIYCALGQVEQAVELHEQALRITQEISNPGGEAYHLIGLARAFLSGGKCTEARQSCEKALSLKIPTRTYQAMMVLGIALLHLHDQTAGEIFTKSLAHCRAILDKTPGLYRPCYVLATALVGQAVCDSQWANQRVELLAPALEEYRRALAITSAAGIVGDALRDLELIRRAGIEGLEPVFDLLQGALSQASSQD